MIKILNSIAFLAFCLTANAQIPVSDYQAAILQQKLDSCVTTFNIPGISATIFLPDNRYWNGASGLSDIYSLDSMDINHLSYQASVTKMFVATVVFQLIEQNFLSLDDSVGQYLPAIPTVPSSTQIRYLLNHRSGLYDVFSNNAATQNWYTTPDVLWNPLTVIQTYNNNPIFNQGNGFSYSNTNYMLLGLIIEQVTGSSFSQVINDQILTPFNLTQTFFLPFDSIIGTLTPGWTVSNTPNTYDTDASVVLTDCFTSMAYTSGALVSHPQDIAKFNRLLFSGQLLNSSSLDIMKTCTNVNLGNGCNGYGHGFMRYSLSGNTYYGHAGDINGFTQLTIHQEADSITLAISINRNFAPRGPIAIALLSVIQEVLVVGVKESGESNLSFNLYPNPTNGTIKLDILRSETSNLEVEIFDVFGHQVYMKSLIDGVLQHVINMENYRSGVYFLKLSSGFSSETRKIVVQY